MAPAVFAQPFASMPMKTKAPRILHLAAAFAAAFGLLLAGCESKPKPKAFSVKVTLDQALAGSSLQVDLIGANELSDLPKYQSYSVSEYWKPGNTMRRNADKVVFEFGQGKPMVQTFTAADPAWKRWMGSGAMYLVVMVDLPQLADDMAGNADARRLILPLDTKKWPKDVATIELLVQESGVRLLTAMKPR
jgi:hypothetical protein